MKHLGIRLDLNDKCQVFLWLKNRYFKKIGSVKMIMFY